MISRALSAQVMDSGAARARLVRRSWRIMRSSAIVEERSGKVVIRLVDLEAKWRRWGKFLVCASVGGLVGITGEGGGGSTEYELFYAV